MSPALPPNSPLNASQLDSLQQWIGHKEIARDWVTPRTIVAARAMFDREPVVPKEGEPIPPCWHWFFAPQIVRRSELGADGHPARGGFIPPIPLPRRMWAGSKLEFNAPIRIGDKLERRSEVVSITPKQGASGLLVFVEVRHSYTTHTGGETIDTHTIVYRDEPKAGEPAKPAKAEALPEGAEFERTYETDSTLLFRMSALTFNGHRIHYDQPYATGTEGYEGILVHGPLIALSLLDALAHHDPKSRPKTFKFSLRKPIAVPTPMTAKGKRTAEGWEVWMEANGAVACVANVGV